MSSNDVYPPRLPLCGQPHGAERTEEVSGDLQLLPSRAGTHHLPPVISLDQLNFWLGSWKLPQPGLKSCSSSLTAGEGAAVVLKSGHAQLPPDHSAAVAPNHISGTRGSSEQPSTMGKKHTAAKGESLLSHPWLDPR